jgi:hypothetical protein
MVEYTHKTGKIWDEIGGNGGAFRSGAGEDQKEPLKSCGLPQLRGYYFACSYHAGEKQREPHKD